MSTTLEFDFLIAGDYTLTIEDPNCSSLITRNYTLTQPDELVITATLVDPINCFGGLATYDITAGLLLIINSKKIFSENSHLTKPGHWAGFIAGFSAVLANPKASLFYMTLLPNFFDFNKINLLDILFICYLSAFVPMVGNLILAGALGKIKKYLLSSSAILKMNIFSGIALIIVGLCITIL